MDTLPATTQTLFGCAGLLSQNMQAVIMKQGTCALVRARGGGGHLAAYGTLSPSKTRQPAGNLHTTCCYAVLIVSSEHSDHYFMHFAQCCSKVNHQRLLCKRWWRA